MSARKTEGQGREFDEKDRDSAKEIYLKEILDWKHAWMNQRQNSEADYQNYFHRAFGIDANMQHSLATRLVNRFHGTPTEMDSLVASNTEMYEILSDLNVILKTALHNGHHDLIERVRAVVEKKENPQ